MTTPPVFSRNPDEWQMLREKHLLIVGIGSVGSAIALMAARAGVGQFTLIDPDVLSPENVCRHFCDLSTVGSTKVRAIKKSILQVNPQATVTTYARDFRELVQDGLVIGPDNTSLLIGATDSFACQSLLNALSLENQIPALFVGCWGAAAVGEILYVKPGRTPCYECYAHFRRTREDGHTSDRRKYSDPEFDITRTSPQSGLWSNILIICGFAFQIVSALLSRKHLEIVDDTHTLLLVNVADSDSGLPFWAVSRGIVARGCAVCDESLVDKIGEG